MKIKPLSAVLALLIPCLAQAGNDDLARHFQNGHEKAKRALIVVWANPNAEPAALTRAVFDVARYETYLATLGGIAPNDERMVQRLAGQGLKVRTRADYGAFAYRVFKHEVGLATGFKPDPANLFRGAMTIEPVAEAEREPR